MAHIEGEHVPDVYLSAADDLCRQRYESGHTILDEMTGLSKRDVYALELKAFHEKLNALVGADIISPLNSTGALK